MCVLSVVKITKISMAVHSLLYIHTRSVCGLYQNKHITGFWRPSLSTPTSDYVPIDIPSGRLSMIYKYLIDRQDHLLQQFSENPYKVLPHFISVHTCWVSLAFVGI